MLPRNFSQGSVKGNPKMHKANVPLRLIISGINHPTENIAEFAEKELEQHVARQEIVQVTVVPIHLSMY
jgi:hypothetical protein